MKTLIPPNTSKIIVDFGSKKGVSNVNLFSKLTDIQYELLTRILNIP